MRLLTGAALHVTGGREGDKGDMDRQRSLAFRQSRLRPDHDGVPSQERCRKQSVRQAGHLPDQTLLFGPCEQVALTENAAGEELAEARPPAGNHHDPSTLWDAAPSALHHLNPSVSPVCGLVSLPAHSPGLAQK